MNCPECGKEQLCPCTNCHKKNKDKVVWKYNTEDHTISCGHCGHTMPDMDWYMESLKDMPLSIK